MLFRSRNSVFANIVRKIRIRANFGAFPSPLDLPECGPCGRVGWVTYVVRSTLFRRVGVAKSGSKIEMSQNSPRPLEINGLSVAEYEYDDARVVRNRLISQRSCSVTKMFLKQW